MSQKFKVAIAMPTPDGSSLPQPDGTCEKLAYFPLAEVSTRAEAIKYAHATLRDKPDAAWAYIWGEGEYGQAQRIVRDAKKAMKPPVFFDTAREANIWAQTHLEANGKWFIHRKHPTGKYIISNHIDADRLYFDEDAVLVTLCGSSMPTGGMTREDIDRLTELASQNPNFRVRQCGGTGLLLVPYKQRRKLDS